MLRCARGLSGQSQSSLIHPLLFSRLQKKKTSDNRFNVIVAQDLWAVCSHTLLVISHWNKHRGCFSKNRSCRRQHWRLFLDNKLFFFISFLLPGIDLENIVYYKDSTHYFVMTAKKQSLLDKGVILNVGGFCSFIDSDSEFNSPHRPLHKTHISGEGRWIIGEYLKGVSMSTGGSICLRTSIDGS